MEEFEEENYDLEQLIAIGKRKKLRNLGDHAAEAFLKTIMFELQNIRAENELEEDEALYVAHHAIATLSMLGLGIYAADLKGPDDNWVQTFVDTMGYFNEVLDDKVCEMAQSIAEFNQERSLSSMH